MTNIVIYKPKISIVNKNIKINRNNVFTSFQILRKELYACLKIKNLNLYKIKKNNL
jgi:hypothetical protein